MSINPFQFVINYDRDLATSMSQELECQQKAVVAFERRGHGMVLKNRLDEHSAIPRIYLISNACVERLGKDAALRKEYGSLIDMILDFAKKNPLHSGYEFYYKFIVHEEAF